MTKTRRWLRAAGGNRTASYSRASHGRAPADGLDGALGGLTHARRCLLGRATLSAGRSSATEQPSASASLKSHLWRTGAAFLRLPCLDGVIGDAKPGGERLFSQASTQAHFPQRESTSECPPFIYFWHVAPPRAIAFISRPQQRARDSAGGNGRRYRGRPPEGELHDPRLLLQSKFEPTGSS
jgi:hypothetical protein